MSDNGQPLTAQLGDKTYAGEWTLTGRTVRVVCAHGSKTAVAGIWGRPIATAERLLVELHDEAGRL